MLSSHSIFGRARRTPPRNSRRPLLSTPWLKTRLSLHHLEDRSVPAVITVTNTLDTVAVDGSVSLREAFDSINAGTNINADVVAMGTYGGGDSIDFNSGTFSGTKTILMSGVELKINRGTTVTGPIGGVVLDAGGLSRILNIDVAIATDTVSLSNLTITNGKTTGTAASANGAGIQNVDSKLILTNVTVSNCVNVNRSGGGINISTASGSLNLIDSVVTNNSAPTALRTGGGINVQGNSIVTLLRSTVSDNRAGRNGGGISMQSGGNLTVDDSTISGNQADVADSGGGGGIFLNYTPTQIRNSTISGNSSRAVGAGIRVISYYPLTIKNSTIAYNSVIGIGGGIGSTSAKTGVVLESTILSNNTGTQGSPDANVPINANYSLIGNTTGTTISGIGNLLDVSANLAPLNFYGGPTRTHALRPGSMAVNAGSNFDALANDQRGSGFPRQDGSSTDIGAFEGIETRPIGDLTPISPIVSAGPTPNTVEVTFSDDVGINAASIDLGDIQILNPASVPLAITGVSFTPLGTGGKALYTFTVPGGFWNEADNGKYTVKLLANQVFDNDAPTSQSARAITLGSFQVAVPITYVVDETTDVDDGKTAVGQLSIREALNLANLDNNPSAIVFDPTVFSGNKTVTMTGGELKILEGVTISGPVGGVVLDAVQASRVFNIDVTTPGDAVSISRLTMTNGKLVSTTFDGKSNGGGIVNVDADLTLSNSIVSNSTTNKNGGGVALMSALANFTLIDSTITGNRAEPASPTDGTYDRFGGGIFINAASTVVTIRRSTISFNQSGRSGGGIFMFSSAKLVIDDSAITGNQATRGNFSYGPGGGGIGFFSGGEAIIRNSTIAGNVAKWDGGGISLQTQGGLAKLTLKNSTVAYNSVLGSGGGIGIGISTHSSTIQFVLESTIVANNSATVDGPDINMAITANYSLIGNTSGGTITGSNNQLNVSAGLAPLNLYGGATRTVGLAPGSVAIDNGSNVDSLLTDQRGLPRQTGANVDIGAFEGMITSPIPALSPVAPIVTPGSTPNTVVVTYSDDVGIDASKIDIGDIQILGPTGTPLAITNASFVPGGKGGQATYTFTPPGGSWDSTDNGRYTVNLFANQVYDVDVPTPQAALAVTLGSFDSAVPIVYVVSEATDVIDGKTGTGQLSLREAIVAANADLSPSRIVFDPIVFAGATTITLNGDDYEITEGVSITGPTARLVIDANFKSRHFDNILNTAGDSISLSNLYLVNGVSPFYGGSISDQRSNLTLTNVHLSNNVAPSHGGAIFFVGSYHRLTMIDCTVTDNLTQNKGTGGGIATFAGGSASVTLIRTTVANNKSGGGGGGLYITNGHRLYLESSTVSGNTANQSGSTSPNLPAYAAGGGIHLFNSRATIINSTISSNTILGSALGGGGIFAFSGTRLSILNSTIAANTAIGAGGGIGQRIDGNFSPSITMESSIVAGNSAPAGAPDIQGAVTANFSLVGNPFDATITGTDNLTNVDPLLGPLANNGGPTQTHALLPGSPAINAGNNLLGLITDQRGNNRDTAPRTDIGAYEVNKAAQITSVVINGGDKQRSLVTQIQLTFNQHVGFSGSAFSLTRVGDNAAVNLAASVDDTGSGSVVTLTFTGGAVDGKSLADGRYALHALAGSFNAEGLDGNGDGIAGDNYIFDQAASPAPLDASKIFRLFGDGDGNGTVNAVDFALFRSVFGLSGPSIFDFNNDNQTNAADFAQFRARFGLTI